MSNYTKDELVTLVQENPEEFNSWKQNQDEEVATSKYYKKCAAYFKHR